VIPDESHPVWAGLIEGTIKHDFGYAAASMLLFNLNLQWRRDPGRLPQLIQNARTFFGRYQQLLSADIAQLFTQQ
jgi:hypothetical protein